jgi:ABC-2 type transport system permease protein/oleandomycin transport system permease protein
MTTLTARADLLLPSPRRSKLAWAAADSLAVAKRNIIGMTRRPQLLGFVTIQPVLFVLMFRYVFGGSIHIPRVNYTNYLMAGIFVTTVLFGAQNTAIGMAEDLHHGLIERFRSLPMARSAVLAGRVLADAVRNLFVIVLMLGVGYLVGFRLHTNLAALVAATGVLLLFGFAISWVTALLGLAAKSAEAAGAAALPLTVLLTFPSSAFLLTRNLPGPLRAYADHQPLTATVNTIRPLLLGGPAAAHAVAAILWCAGIIAVFAPLAVLRYRRAARPLLAALGLTDNSGPAERPAIIRPREQSS